MTTPKRPPMSALQQPNDLGDDYRQTGRTIVRQNGAATRAAHRIIECSDWTQIDLATPTINRGVQPTGMIASSDTHDNYDGTTAASKMIFQFESPYVYNTIDKALFLAGRIYNSNPITATTFASANREAWLTWRFRPILAAFTCSAQNWNNFGSLTLGAAEEALLSIDISVAANSLITQFQGPGLALSGQLSSGATFTAYGMVFDCKPSWNLGPQPTVLTGIMQIVATDVGGGITNPIGKPLLIVS